MKKFPFFFVLLFSPLAVAAEDSLPDLPGGGAGEIVAFLMKAFQGGDWFAVGGVAVMLTVWALSRFVANRDWLPVLSAGVGMIYSIAVTAAGGGHPWYEALYLGLLSSGPATLFWSLLGKRLLPAKKE